MQTLPLSLSKTLLQKWANNNKMPDVAKEVAAVEEPAPSPAQVELERLQLEAAQLDIQLKKAEIAKLEAETDRVNVHSYEGIGRLVDDQSKADKLSGEARMKNAQARKLESETDEIDRAHIEKLDGVDRQRDIEDKQFAMEGEMAKLNTRGNN